MRLNYQNCKKGQTFCLIAMFVWSVLLAVITRGRNVFTDTRPDKASIIIFILEAISLTAFIFFYIMRKIRESHMDKETYPRHMFRRGRVLTLISFVTACGFTLTGFLLSDKLKSCKNIAKVGFITAVCYFALIIVINYIALRIYSHINRPINREDALKTILAQREDALYTSLHLLKLLNLIMRLSDIYAGIFVIAGIVTGFCAGMIFVPYLALTMAFLSAFFIMTGLFHIRIYTEIKTDMNDEDLLKKEDYPRFYEIAQNAADKIGVQSKIRLHINKAFNATIYTNFSGTDIYLGAMFLDLMGDDELYATLLHEFTHYVITMEKTFKIKNYDWFYDASGNLTFFSWLLYIPYKFFCTAHSWNYSKYRYASSIIEEQQADSSMAKFADKHVIASMLTKLNYYDYYIWEDNLADFTNCYKDIVPPKNNIRPYTFMFKKSISQRHEIWDNFLMNELYSRSSTHPLLRQRLAQIGIDRIEPVSFISSDEYKKEKNKAIRFFDDAFFENKCEECKKGRVNAYIKPLKFIKNWEKQGKPINSLNYVDVIENLKMLGRVKDAFNICEEYIKTNTSAEQAHHANYFYGEFLLYKWDDKGIDYIYKAIETNSNYIDDGLDKIGSYATMTGNQKELDRYRQETLKYMDKQDKIYDQLSTLDEHSNLVHENLEGTMLEDNIEYIKSIENGTLERVYLVRKQITDDFFSSIFILEFFEGTPMKKAEEVYHKLFLRLDDGEASAGWQYSLLYYKRDYDKYLCKVPDCCVYTSDKAESKDTVQKKKVKA